MGCETRVNFSLALLFLLVFIGGCEVSVKIKDVEIEHYLENEWNKFAEWMDKHETASWIICGIIGVSAFFAFIGKRASTDLIGELMANALIFLVVGIPLILIGIGFCMLLIYVIFPLMEWIF